MHARRRLNPAKLRLSKWTAVSPRDREKHFLVTDLVLPDDPSQPVTEVMLQAVLTRRTQRIAWRLLTDEQCWKQGWQ